MIFLTNISIKIFNPKNHQKITQIKLAITQGTSFNSKFISKSRKIKNRFRFEKLINSLIIHKIKEQQKEAGCSYTHPCDVTVLNLQCITGYSQCVAQ